MHEWLSNIGYNCTLEDLSRRYWLYIANRRLTSVPKEIGNLKNLIRLDLTYCKLTSIPKEIGKLKNLKVLNLRDNQLTSIPKELCNLNNLEWLGLRDNPNLVLFEDHVTWIKGLQHCILPKDYKVVPRNENTDILFG